MRTSVLILIIFNLMSCNGQTAQDRTTVSDNFDTTPPIYYGMPDNVTSIDTSAAWNLGGQKLQLSGIIYQENGKTPAPNVLLYYYQTDLNGQYVHKASEQRSMPPNELGQTHGYIRGWIKSDQNGA